MVVTPFLGVTAGSSGRSVRSSFVGYKLLQPLSLFIMRKFMSLHIIDFSCDANKTYLLLAQTNNSSIVSLDRHQARGSLKKHYALSVSV